jgi:hypothetical protein
MEGISDFEKLRNFRGKKVNINIEEISESWDRDGEDDDDCYYYSSSMLTENRIFDNLYLSGKGDKLALLSIKDNNGLLFLPFCYSYTSYLQFRYMRRDTKWKIRNISCNGTSITISENLTEEYSEPINWKDNARYLEVLVSGKKEHIRNQEDLPCDLSKLYKMFE